MIHTEQDLRQAIEARYTSNRAFCVAFEQVTGVKLDETTLSRQLSGRIALSGFALAAYRLFFQVYEQLAF